MVEQELSVPETFLPGTTANNESHLGALHLNNCVCQGISDTNVSLCHLDSYAQENLKNLLNEKLNEKLAVTQI